MSEKKKGFWSWLGFGKKEEAEQKEIQQEQESIQPEQPVIVEPETEKSFSEKLDELEDKLKKR